MMIIINFTIFLSPYKEIPYTLAVIPLVSLPSKPSVQFTHSVMSNSLWPNGLQHARPLCLSPAPRVNPIHVHSVGDAIQPSHPLSSPSPPAVNLSQLQGLFQWVSSSHQIVKVWLLCPWDSLGKNTGVDCHAVLQGIFYYLLQWQAGSLPLASWNP